jgi:hypothetical protein
MSRSLLSTASFRHDSQVGLNQPSGRASPEPGSHSPGQPPREIPSFERSYSAPLPRSRSTVGEPPFTSSAGPMEDEIGPEDGANLEAKGPSKRLARRHSFNTIADKPRVTRRSTRCVGFSASPFNPPLIAKAGRSHAKTEARSRRCAASYILGAGTTREQASSDGRGVTSQFRGHPPNIVDARWLSSTPLFPMSQTVIDSYDTAVDSLASRLDARQDQVKTLSERARWLLDSASEGIDADAVVKGYEGLVYAQDVLEEKVGEVSLFQTSLESKLDNDGGRIPKGMRELRAAAGSDTGVAMAFETVSCPLSFSRDRSLTAECGTMHVDVALARVARVSLPATAIPRLRQPGCKRRHEFGRGTADPG